MVEADSEGVVIEIMTIVFSIYRTKKKKTFVRWYCLLVMD